MMKQNLSQMVIVRQLVQRFTAEELDQCVTQQVNESNNTCLAGNDAGNLLDELTKANFIKHLVEHGMPDQEAFRELGRRMRVLLGEH